MAFSISSSSSNRGGRQTPTAIAEINVVPMVDVMLVLLVIFMVTAPLMQQGVTVDLPKANAQSISELPEQITLVVSKQQKITMNGNILPAGSLKARLEAIVAAKPGIEVFIQADQAVPYGFIARLMAEVKESKVNRVGLVTQPGEPGSHL